MSGLRPIEAVPTGELWIDSLPELVLHQSHWGEPTAAEFQMQIRNPDRLELEQAIAHVSALSPRGGSLKIVARSIRFSLVIPTYEEADNIESLVRSLVDVLDRVLPNDYEIIVVDDNSTDRTWKIAQELTAEFAQLRVLCRHYERGLATAVIRGWQVAKGDILGVIDGDGQHDEQILPEMVAQVLAGADLVAASRNDPGGGISEWSLWRRLTSRGAQIFGLAILPDVVGRVSDPLSGYFVLKRSAIAQKNLNPLGYKILIEVLAKGDFARVKTIPYEFRERQSGETKVTWYHAIDYLAHLLRLRLDRFPLQRFFRFGMVGASGVIVDMAVLYALSDPSTLAWGLTRSKIIAAEVAIFNNFWWNDRWTFRDLSQRQTGLRRRLERFLKFNLICLMGLILNVLILNLVFNVLFAGQHRYLANLIAIALVTFWNFWLNTKLNWRVTDRDRAELLAPKSAP